MSSCHCPTHILSAHSALRCPIAVSSEVITCLCRTCRSRDGCMSQRGFCTPSIPSSKLQTRQSTLDGSLSTVHSRQFRLRLWTHIVALPRASPLPDGPWPSPSAPLKSFRGTYCVCSTLVCDTAHAALHCGKNHDSHGGERCLWKELACKMAIAQGELDR